MPRARTRTRRTSRRPRSSAAARGATSPARPGTGIPVASAIREARRPRSSSRDCRTSSSLARRTTSDSHGATSDARTRSRSRCPRAGPADRPSSSRTRPTSRRASGAGTTRTRCPPHISPRRADDRSSSSKTAVRSASRSPSSRRRRTSSSSRPGSSRAMPQGRWTETESSRSGRPCDASGRDPHPAAPHRRRAATSIRARSRSGSSVSSRSVGPYVAAVRSAQRKRTPKVAVDSTTYTRARPTKSR